MTSEQIQDTFNVCDIWCYLPLIFTFILISPILFLLLARWVEVVYHIFTGKHL